MHCYIKKHDQLVSNIPLRIRSTEIKYLCIFCIHTNQNGPLISQTTIRFWGSYSMKSQPFVEHLILNTLRIFEFRNHKLILVLIIEIEF